MKYQIGDRVIHWVYGLGKITGIDQKCLAGQSCLYYVVQIDNLTIWVPVDEEGQSCLRYPTPSAEFKMLFRLLSSPGDKLNEYHFERQKELARRLQQRTLVDICHVICDLHTLSRVQKLNHHDHAVLKRAKENLFVEWEFSLGTPRANAQRELEVLLGKNDAGSAIR